MQNKNKVSVVRQSLTTWKYVREKICGLFVEKKQTDANFHIFCPQWNNFGILLKWMIHSNASFDSIILPLLVLEVVQKLCSNHFFLDYNFALCHSQKTFCRDCLHSSLPVEPVGFLKETWIFPYQLIYSASQCVACIQTCTDAYINLINKVYPIRRLWK